MNLFQLLSILGARTVDVPTGPNADKCLGLLKAMLLLRGARRQCPLGNDVHHFHVPKTTQTEQSGRALKGLFRLCDGACPGADDAAAGI
jgi:hypothetical protein